MQKILRRSEMGQIIAKRRVDNKKSIVDLIHNIFNMLSLKRR